MTLNQWTKSKDESTQKSVQAYTLTIKIMTFDSFLSFRKFDSVGVSIIINFHVLLEYGRVKSVFWNKPDRLTTSSDVKLWCPPSPWPG